ncbi:MAG: NAD(P)/FAD-dependent oxidoreductase [Peptostreptococcaceae bacterium]|nr:NAD(P)/FAD-dependent oxidoreductase [Peptostreptococcaceae bacterium]
MKQYDIIIVGAGPAGMMAAIASNRKVALLDKNESVGKKLRITGGGRCNITSNIDIADFFEKIPRNNKFLYKAFHHFTNKDLLSFFEKEGIRFKKENQKIYPMSDKADEIIDILWRKCREKSDIHLGCEVIDFEKESSGYRVETNRQSFYGKKIIFAGGGASFASTGSDFGLCNLLLKKGIKIQSALPSLVRVQSNSDWIRKSAGISLNPVAVHLFENNKKFKVIEGDILFTHTGISGPAVLDASAYLTGNPSSMRMALDLLPRLSEEEITTILKQKDGKNIIGKLSAFLPKNLLKNIFDDAEVDFHNLKKTAMNDLLAKIKNAPVAITGLGSIKEAIVTRGGVDVKEIDPSTMMLKKMKDIYVAGEMIDVDALTGGYNLQIAFSTGKLAGKSASESLE